MEYQADPRTPAHDEKANGYMGIIIAVEVREDDEMVTVEWLISPFKAATRVCYRDNVRKVGHLDDI